MIAILIFSTFSAFSPKFGELFGEVSFRQSGFSAKRLFGKVVFGKVSCIESENSEMIICLDSFSKQISSIWVYFDLYQSF